MTVFDFSIAGVVLLSALVGFAVGFVKGGLFLASWLGAVLVTLYSYTAIRPLASEVTDNRLIADFGTGVVIFVVTLGLFYLLSALVGGWVRRSRLNALDRSLGLLGGIVVGAAVVSGAYIPLTYVWDQDEQPGWLKEAKLKPWVAMGAGAILRLAPDEMIGDANGALRRLEDQAPAVGAAEKLLRPPAAADGRRGGETGYTDEVRKELQRAIEANQ